MSEYRIKEIETEGFYPQVEDYGRWKYIEWDGEERGRFMLKAETTPRCKAGSLAQAESRCREYEKFINPPQKKIKYHNVVV